MSHPGNSHLTPTSQEATPQFQYRNSNCYLIVRRLIITLILLILIISVVSWIAWLTVHPAPPVFTVKSFSVANFILYPDSRMLKADYEFELSVRNPNKKVSLFIDYFDISLFYRAADITKTRTEAMYLDKMSQRDVHPRPSRNSERQLRGIVFNDLMNDYSSNSEVSFSVRMLIGTRFRSGVLPTKRRAMKVSCTNLVVEFLDAKEKGKLKANGGKACSVHYAY